MKILFWPDACWCYEDEVCEMSHKSDDFGTLELDESKGYEPHHIDAAVIEALHPELDPEDTDPYDIADGSLK